MNNKNNSDDLLQQIHKDLECEYAEKLLEIKKQMAIELKEDLKQLVEKVDAFVEERLRVELEELFDDVKDIRGVLLLKEVKEARKKGMVH